MKKYLFMFISEFKTHSKNIITEIIEFNLVWVLGLAGYIPLLIIVSSTTKNAQQNISAQSLIIFTYCLQLLTTPLRSAAFRFLWNYREGNLIQHLVRPIPFIILMYQRWLRHLNFILSIFFSIVIFLIFEIIFLKNSLLLIDIGTFLATSVCIILFEGLLITLSMFSNRNPPLDYFLSILWKFSLVSPEYHSQIVRIIITFIPSGIGAWLILQAHRYFFIIIGEILFILLLLLFFSFGKKMIWKRVGQYAN